MLPRWLKNIFRETPGVPTSDGFFLDVRCPSCGEAFHLFINKSTDLFQEFDPDGQVTYRLNKEIIGGQCRNLIRVGMVFDGAKRLKSKEIENGEFIESP